MDLDRQLAELSKHIQKLKAQLSKEEGQLGAYQAQLDQIVEECRSHNIDPTQLNGIIKQKEQQLSELVSGIEHDLEVVDKQRSEIFESVRT